MLTKIKTKNSGFTIVEIMIVMAIIGMMLLAMLLVVPALRRTQRNKQRRDDVGQMIAAISEYGTNNNGALPPNTAAIVGTSGGNYTDGLVKLAFYDGSEVNYLYSTSAVTSEPGTDANVVYIRNFAKCTGNAIASSGATRRNIVAYYQVETSSGTTKQCQES